MKPILSREFGGVPAAQTRDGRSHGVTAAETAACLRNERRENCMVCLSLETCWQAVAAHTGKTAATLGEENAILVRRERKVKYGTIGEQV
jgi:hypothetical protein